MISLRVAAALLTSLVIACSVASGGKVPFVNPTTQGGSFLLMAGNNLGEPLNVVISGQSSPAVLTNAGFLNYARAVGFTTECFGLTLGAPFTANLGDGKGPQPQIMELRESFGNALFGACVEMFLGGNHLRMFRQDGPKANTSALFLATSTEEGLFQNHTIAANGYDVGRDGFVQMATGLIQFNGTSYNTTVQTLEGVLPVGSEGVNHGIALDGNAFLLTVTVV